MGNKTDVPTFKLAKVGQDREKKRGGIPLYFGSAGVKVPAGLVRVFPSIYTVGGKIALMVIAGVFGIAGRSIAINSRAAAERAAKLSGANKKPKAFERPKYSDADLSKVQKSGDRPQDSLGMIAGAMGPKSDASGAAGAADGAGADGSKSDSEKAGDSEKAPEDAKGAAAGPAGGIDPAAMAAAAGAAAGAGDSGKAKSPFASRFGAMSSGLSGGAGMSGGVGRAFGGPALGERLGSMKGFQKPSAPSRTTQPLARASGVRGRGKAMRQLSKAAQLSQLGASARGEQSAAYGQAAFDNNPGQTQAITGAGTRPTGADGGDSGGGGGNPNSGGGGGGGPTEGFGGGTEQATMDDCSLEGPDYINTAAGGCEKVQDVAGANATPWQMYIDIASYALLAAGVLLTFCGILGYFAKMPPASAALWSMIATMAKLAALLAGVATLMGIMTIISGAPLQGGVLTGLGAFTTTMAILTAVSAGSASEGNATDLIKTHAIDTTNVITGILTSTYSGMSAAKPDWANNDEGSNYFNPDDGTFEADK